MSTLMEAFVQTGDRSKTVLTTFTGNYHTGDLEQQTDTFEHLLREHDIQGKRIGLLVPNVFAYLALTMAVNRLGGIIVPISWQYRSEDLKEILKFLDPHIVFTVAKHGGFPFGDMIEEWAKSSGNHTVVYQSEDCFHWKKYNFGLAEKSLENPQMDFIFCTSGSTGLPKALMMTVSGIDYSVGFVKDAYDLASGDRLFMMAPPTSVFGLVSLFAALQAGTLIVFPDAFELPMIVKLMKQTNTNKITTTPSIMKAIYPFAKQMASDIIDNLELCSLSGEPVTGEIVEIIPLNPQCHFIGVYGISEMGGIMHANLREKTEWSVNHSVQYTIADDGEFLIRTPGAFTGYYKQPELTSEVWTADGWFQTGDLVQKNENNKLEIIGRKKDLIKKGGQQVIPGEVEKILLQHPNVKQVVVLGMPHPVYGEQVAAFTALHDESAVHELYPFCAERTARYKVPDAIEIISEIPIANGKIDKVALRNIFLSKKGKSE
jgi:acyl-CoA synthetase (AMP-forming)/AMP-acid ligase II